MLECIHNKEKGNLTMKITDKKAREIFKSLDDGNLLDMFYELGTGEDIINIDDYIADNVGNVEEIKQFVDNIQGNDSVDIYDEYIYFATYIYDWKSGNTIKELLTEQDWLNIIQDCYEDIDEDDED